MLLLRIFLFFFVNWCNEMQHFDVMLTISNWKKTLLLTLRINFECLILSAYSDTPTTVSTPFHDFNLSLLNSCEFLVQWWLTLFPLGRGHGVSLHIQIISFQMWIQLYGWKLYDNMISSLLHIWEEWISYFITKNFENFEFENM